MTDTAQFFSEEVSDEEKSAQYIKEMGLTFASAEKDSKAGDVILAYVSFAVLKSPTGDAHLAHSFGGEPREIVSGLREIARQVEELLALHAAKGARA